MGGEMKLKLKPCPFCGSPAVLERDSDHHGEWFNLGCARHWGAVPDDQEPCIGGRVFYTEIETSEAAAIAAWNRRSPDPELVEALSAVVFNSTHGNGLEAQHQALDRARALLSRIREGGEG